MFRFLVSLEDGEPNDLALLAEGLTNSQIAARLVVSRRTIDHHVATTLRKRSVHMRAEVSGRAVRLGLAGQDR